MYGDCSAGFVCLLLGISALIFALTRPSRRSMWLFAAFILFELIGFSAVRAMDLIGDISPTYDVEESLELLNILVLLLSRGLSVCALLAFIFIALIDARRAQRALPPTE